MYVGDTTALLTDRLWERKQGIHRQRNTQTDDNESVTSSGLPLWKNEPRPLPNHKAGLEEKEHFLLHCTRFASIQEASVFLGLVEQEYEIYNKLAVYLCELAWGDWNIGLASCWSCWSLRVCQRLLRLHKMNTAFYTNKKRNHTTIEFHHQKESDEIW